MTELSKIGIGSVQFGLPYGISNTTGQTSEEEVSKIFKVAFTNGITIIDTATSYGNSESVIGKNGGEKFDIVTKFMPSSYGISVIDQFEQSLIGLGISELYGYLAHRPLELISNKNDWRVIQDLKIEKKINKVGFSLNDPKEYYQLIEAEIFPDIIQVPFNYFDSRFKEILIELKENGCEIHTRSTFMQGLFFMNKNNLSDFFKPLFTELDYIQSISKNELSSSLLKYVLEQPFIDKVILGIENANQLEDNIKGLSFAIDLKPISKRFSDELLMPMYWPKI
ncbi:aldo/keto reductase [Flavobacterium sp. TMP13]|uniref:aldo/keto reductase n=1 Tax=Flavobacterium sp. TMP13 TaxID=3425950 RepID=UPI003D789C55